MLTVAVVCGHLAVLFVSMMDTSDLSMSLSWNFEFLATNAKLLHQLNNQLHFSVEKISSRMLIPSGVYSFPIVH